MARLLTVFLLVLSVAPGARGGASAAAGWPAGLAAEGQATVVEIVDGDTLRLASGETVRLVGIRAPKHAAGPDASEDEPLAREAAEALSALALDRRVHIAHGGRKRDRHGRLLAHLARADDGLWLQSAMVAAGLARVESFRDNRTGVPNLLRVESAARAARKGIWTRPFHRVRGLADIKPGAFRLVEGRVRAVDTVRGRGYLNFGDDWRTDFTVSIAPRDLRLFADAGIALEDYDGRLLRVRGWVTSFNGPMIEATHPEQIEVLE